jgi:pimeloyl-ACP methyl ester carboxylesterase
LSHLDFRSGFGTVFQGVHRVFPLSGDRWVARAKSTHFALTPKVEYELVDLPHASNSAFISGYQLSSGILHVSCSTPNTASMGTTLPMPVLAIGGEKSFGATQAVVMRNAATTVTEVVIPNAGHWLMEEQPVATITAIRTFLDATH